MKNLCTVAICVCISLGSLTAFAQPTKIPINEPDYNKPRLFQNLPSIIPVSVNKLNNLLSTDQSRPIQTDLSDQSELPFAGSIVSRANAEGNKIQSVVIRSSNFNGATLTISKTINEDGTVTYSGRLISFQHGDAYVLKNQDGHYSLVKKDFNELVSE